VKRLVVVADNPLIVEAIRVGLGNTGEFELLDCATAAMMSARKIVAMAPDIVLVDDMRHSPLAVSLIKRIKKANAGIMVMVLSAQMDQEWLEQIFAAGASGAISKAIPKAALSTLMRETLDGHVVHVGPLLRGATQPAPGAEGTGSLTARELEILRLVAAGSTNGEIARGLWVTEQTVKFHLSNVYRKLDVGNRTQASHYAHVHGLIDDVEALALTGA
jgi:DNA-binding NarL/FixJ family response regulator